MVEQAFLDESCDELANFQLKILREKVEKLTKRNAELEAEKKKVASLARDWGRSTATNLVTDNCKISLRTQGRHVEKVVSFMELARQGAGKKCRKLFTSCTEKFKRPISLLMLKNPKTMMRLGMIKKNFNTRASLFQKVQCENKGRYMYGIEIRAAYSYVSVAVVSNIPEKEIGKAAKVLEVSGKKH